MAYDYKDLTTTHTIPLKKSLQAFKRKAATARLILKNSPADMTVKKLYAIKGPVILGRKKSADIYLKDEKLSRHHAQIHTNGRDYFIKDLNSTNGTKVNGKFITEQKIFPKDIIEIGDIKFEFNFPSLITKDFKHDFSSASTWSHMIKIGLLAGIILFCAALLYYSATKPFSNKRIPQSVVPMTSQWDTRSWLGTQAELFYQLASQAYQKADYHKAEHFLWKAKQYNPHAPQFKKLGHAIQEAILLKKLYLKKLKTREEMEKAADHLNRYLSEAQKHIQEHQWDLAVIAYQEALFIDSENEEARNGIHDIEQLQRADWRQIIKNSHQPSQTLKAYQTIENHLQQAQKLSQNEEYAAAWTHYRKALKISKKHQFETEKITASLSQLDEALKTRIKTLWDEAENRMGTEHHAQAKQAIDKILKMAPHHGPAIQKQKEMAVLLGKQAQMLYSKSVILESLPDIASAKRQWENILTLVSPGHPYYKKAQKKLTQYTSF